jgi:hypothetical protein
MARENATAPRWLNPTEMKAWRRYIIASRRLLEALDSDLDAHDLSMPDYEILVQLSDAPDRSMRMSDLAASALLSRSRLSHRMKVMEKEGWVELDLWITYQKVISKPWQRYLNGLKNHFVKMHRKIRKLLCHL